MKETKQCGLATFSQPCSVADMNQDFCNMEFFSVAHGNKGFQGSELFQIFPEAKRMLTAWANNNFKTLNSETDRECLLSEVIPHYQNICNLELAEQGHPPFKPTL
jgi:hypothetical protein